jgi:protein O-GlcNAc transferase
MHYHYPIAGMPSDSLHSTLQQAVQFHQSGRLPDAEPLYRSVLSQNPFQPDALHLLGVLLSQSNRPAEAIPFLKQAAALQPRSPDVLSNFAIALAQTGETSQAIESFRSALNLRPDHRDAKINLARLLAQHGDILRKEKKLPQAAAAFEESLNLLPDQPETLNLLGVTRAALGQTQLATEAFEKSIALKPDYANPHNNLGLCLEGLGQPDRAIHEYQTAIRLRPNFPGAYNNLGNLLKEQDQLDQAIAAFRQALVLQPNYAQAMVGLAGAFQSQGDPAIDLYHQALANRTDSPDEVENALGNALKNSAQVQEAVAAFRRAIDLNPENPISSSNLVFTLWYDPAASSQQLLEEHRNWDRRHAQPLRSRIHPHLNTRDASRRIRLGYVSPDFRQHATAFCLLPLLSNHDHTNFEIFCYSSVKKPDPITARLRPYADHWIDCASSSDEDLASQIRADQIDLLIDLSMHTSGNRLLLFARKPTPVQAAWIASPCMTGLGTIDYRITDPHLDPPGQTDSLYVEKSLRLPDSFWCYDPLVDQPLPVAPLPARQNGHINFGNLSNACKFNPAVYSLWSKVLAAVPNSRLILRLPEGSSRTFALDQLKIDPSRIRFTGRQPRLQYLQTYNQIDIMLDTLPYNGHMTSLDSLWMGTPVVTLVGQAVVGRAGLSQLTTLALPELVARDESQFIQIAAHLAADLPKLALLRASLRDRMQKSPLMDGPRFAKNVEALYRQMWQTWCAQAGT